HLGADRADRGVDAGARGRRGTVAAGGRAVSTGLLRLLPIVAGFAGLGVAWLVAAAIRRYPEGSAAMAELAGLIRTGALAFLRREYSVLVPFIVVVAGLLTLAIGWRTGAAYVGGALCSILAGFFGMSAATHANLRTAEAAHVGADLVGKLEAGIPEDDPRNPATIADNVGDNVGDVAGMGADIFESYVGAVIATVAIGATSGLVGDRLSAVALPVLYTTAGLAASLVGIAAMRLLERASPQGALRRSPVIAAGLFLVG